MTDELTAALVALERDEAMALVHARSARGEDPLAILEACRQGMTLVGERFQQGDYFLAELLLAAEIFKATAAALEPRLTGAQATASAGTVVLATLQGDIHDLGKGVLATLLRAHAFTVHDLGVNLPPERLVEQVAVLEPDFVGFSALLTTAFDSMRRAAELLAEAGLRQQVKLLVGGGVTTPAVRDYVGADFQSTDATRGVRYCLDNSRESRREP